MLWYYSHSRLLQEAWGNHFSPLSHEPHDDPCEATTYDITASNLPLPASSPCHHPPLPVPLSSCCCPPPQKGEFNSQCGDRCGSDILLKCCGSVEAGDAVVDGNDGVNAAKGSHFNNSPSASLRKYLFFQHPVLIPPRCSPPVDGRRRHCS